MKRAGEDGNWIELRLEGPGESVKVVLHGHIGADVATLVQQSKYLQVKRPLAGTGNRGGFESDAWSCSSFSYYGFTNQRMNGFAANGSTNLPQGMYIGGGPQMVEMVFCDAAPVGTTDHLITVIDGRGGKTDLTLTVEVLEEKSDGGSIEWFASNPNDDGSDSDGDGVPNNEDAFPDDPAAAQDNDSDGRPDRWNLGRNGADSTSSPKLVLDDDDDNDGVLDAVDQMPFDASESLDFDGDGIGDKADNDDDDDGVADADDAFPYDAYNSVDSDGDGVGDNWDNYPNDSNLQSLTLQEALDRVNDPNLRNCISKGQQGASRAQEVVEVFCQVEVDDLGGIQNFYNLKNLYLWNGVGQAALDQLEALTSLELLSIGDRDSYFSDLSPLRQLYKLRDLGLMEAPLIDAESYAVLSRLHNLESLTTTGLSNYSLLAYYPRLKRAGFGRNKVNDHSPIGNLEFLEWLMIKDDEGGLESTAWLRGLVGLKHLEISRMELTDLSFLQDFVVLESLRLEGNGLSELSPLSGLTNLVSLDLRENQVQKVASALGGWTQVASIDLTGNPLLCSELSSLESKSNLTITFDSNCVTDSQNSYIIQGGPCEVLPEHCHEFPVNVTNSSTEFVRNYRYTFAEYPEFRNYPLPGFSGVQFFDGGGPFDVWIKSGSQETRWSNVRSDCLPDPYSQCPGDNSSTGRPNWYNSELDWEAYQDNWRGADIELAIADYPYIDELIGSTQEGSKQISLRIGLLADQGLRAENIALPYSKLEIKPPVPGTGDIGFQGGNCAQVDRGQIFPYMIGQYSNVSLLGDTHISGPSGFPVFEWSGQYIWMCSDHPPGEYDLTLRVYDGIGFKEHPLQLVISSQKVSGGSFTFSDAVIVSDDADGDGVADNFDAFPNDPAASKDFDRDGKPDEWNDGKSANDSTSQPPLERDNDDDNDGVPDDLDCYPLDSTRTICDADLDGVEDSVDNCPAIANPGQEDFDGDGLG
ncbi:MAG: thrombospondin type 3 repeat-containing protein, partial [Rubripirellula sp.]